MKGEKGHNQDVTTCTLWAPACTVDLFKEAYMPSIADITIERFAMFTLTDQAEQDDHCANIYHKSLLYLVSHAFRCSDRAPPFSACKSSSRMTRRSSHCSDNSGPTGSRRRIPSLSGPRRRHALKAMEISTMINPRFRPRSQGSSIDQK
jgi:hypothetical protein